MPKSTRGMGLRELIALKSKSRELYHSNAQEYCAELDKKLSGRIIEVAMNESERVELEILSKHIIQTWRDYTMLRKYVDSISMAYPATNDYEIAVIQYYIEEVEKELAQDAFEMDNLKSIMKFINPKLLAQLKIGVLITFLKVDKDKISGFQGKVSMLVGRIVQSPLDAEMALSVLVVRGERLNEMVASLLFESLCMTLGSNEIWEEYYRGALLSEVLYQERLIGVVNRGLRIRIEDFGIPELLTVLERLEHYCIPEEQLLDKEKSKALLLSNLIDCVDALSDDQVLSFVKKLHCCFDAFKYRDNITKLVLSISAKKKNRSRRVIAVHTIRMAAVKGMPFARMLTLIQRFPVAVTGFKHELLQHALKQNYCIKALWLDKACMNKVHQFLGDVLTRDFIVGKQNTACLKRMIANGEIALKEVLAYKDNKGVLSGRGYNRFLLEIEEASPFSMGVVYDASLSCHELLEKYLQSYNAKQDEFVTDIDMTVIAETAPSDEDVELMISRLLIRDSGIPVLAKARIFDVLRMYVTAIEEDWEEFISDRYTEMPQITLLAGAIGKGLRIHLADFKFGLLLDVVKAIPIYIASDRLLDREAGAKALLTNLIEYSSDCSDQDILSIIKKIPSCFHACRHTALMGKFIQALILQGKMKSMQGVVIQTMREFADEKIEIKDIFESLNKLQAPEPAFLREVVDYVWRQRKYIEQIWCEERSIELMLSFIGRGLMKDKLNNEQSKTVLKELVFERTVSILSVGALEQGMLNGIITDKFCKEMERAMSFTNIKGRSSLAQMEKGSPQFERQSADSDVVVVDPGRVKSMFSEA